MTAFVLCIKKRTVLFEKQSKAVKMNEDASKMQQFLFLFGLPFESEFFEPAKNMFPTTFELITFFKKILLRYSLRFGKAEEQKI